MKTINAAAQLSPEMIDTSSAMTIIYTGIMGAYETPPDRRPADIIPMLTHAYDRLYADFIRMNESLNRDRWPR